MDHEQRASSSTDADILAFIPDVDAAAASTAGPTPSGHPLGRLFSQPTSAKLLLAAAGVLVVAAIVPFLFGKKETPKPMAEVTPAWQPGPVAPNADGGPKWTGGSTAPKTFQTQPGAGKETAPRSIPTTADLRGAVKAPASSPPPTPLFGDRAVPAAPTADERMRMIAPPRNPPAANPDNTLTPDPRDTRYETRRPAAVYERAYQSPPSPVDINRPMTVGDSNAAAPPDYRRDAVPNYRQELVPDYRREAAPDYRREATSDYRREAAPDYRQDPATDYRRDAVPDYRREMPADYRQDTAADYRRDGTGTAGYRQDNVPDYRRQAAPDYRTEVPADYRSAATPGLADRRMTPPPAGGQLPGAGQPGVARIEGIIDTPPARTSHEFARPGVY